MKENGVWRLAMELGETSVVLSKNGGIVSAIDYSKGSDDLVKTIAFPEEGI